jgi:hypothetical protein
MTMRPAGDLGIILPGMDMGMGMGILRGIWIRIWDFRLGMKGFSLMMNPL